MKTFAILSVIALVGCSDPFSMVPEHESLVPPTAYQELWKETEDCLGVRGNFNQIAWYVVKTGEASSWDCDEAPNGGCAGLYTNSSIFLAEGVIHDSLTPGITTIAYPDSTVNFQGLSYHSVRHEIMHALKPGDLHHSNPLWDQCTWRVRM